jgi:ribosomal protein S12 methylthiotransferase accessory factor
MEPIKVSFPGGKRVDVVIGNFTIQTDQSKKYGGEESAPEPFSLFLASIASCAGVFALGFCEKRELSTTGLDLEMICDWDAKLKRITRMTLRLTLPEGFPEKYRDGIIRAMNLCTVKKHIFEAPEFVVEAV